ncbi:MAG: transglycosylase domain-containing protein [Clostridia bacterium]|nr:transglycosylase domain-containing protein [Clostridia bacterium]
MEKPFKWLCLFMTVVILVSSVLLASSVKDFLNTIDSIVGGKEVVTDIKNYELNMTSVVYFQNDMGAWEEYQRLHGDENRIWVDIENIPQRLIDAFIAIEDQRFYKHGGVDWKRTLSAFINYLPFVNIYNSNQGGSTITQQLIKNITNDRDKSVNRKFREILRAQYIEKELSKKEILEAYLNTISLGSGICGVQVAANYYFNKDVAQLSIAECASLAAITKNPSKYNPDTKPADNQKRRKSVLDKMFDLGMISSKEYQTAVESEVIVNKAQQSNFELPINSYYIDTLISDISADLAQLKGITEESASKLLYNGGFRIYSTINPSIQEKMEEVYKDVDKYFPIKSRKDKEKSVQSAMTILDYEGNIKGIIGGVGEKKVNRGLNRAWESPRQPGSTMKPLGAYSLAIDRGIISYSSVVDDKPVPNYYGNGKAGPREWYGGYEGRIKVRRAIAHSANTIPIQLISKIGLEDAYSFLKYDLNFTYLSEVDINPASLAIGGCEYGITTTQSAAAYSIFGNHGIYNKPKTYYKVTDANGSIVLSREEGRQVLKPEAADIMNKLLQGVIYDEGGTGRKAAGYSSMRAYGKTGTSSEANDSWFVGGSPYYFASVWCGFDQPENMKVTTLASTVWRTVMSEIHKKLPKKDFEMSNSIIKASFCTNTGLKAGPNCNTETGYCVPGVYYKQCDGVHIYEDEKTPDFVGELTSSQDTTTQSSSQAATPDMQNNESSSGTASSGSETSSLTSSSSSGAGSSTASDSSQQGTGSTNSSN